MERAIDSAGGWLRLLLYAVQLAALAAVLLFVAPPLDSAAGAAFALLFAALVAATVFGLWRRKSDDGPTRAGTVEDITYDPFADPGQAARDRWEKAIQRLPGGDERD